MARSDIDKAIDRIENMVVSVYAPGNRDHIRHMFKRDTVRKVLEELIEDRQSKNIMEPIKNQT